MQYKDFVLQLEVAAGGGYVARILDSPFGTDQDVWALPFPPQEAERRLADFDAAFLSFKKRQGGAAKKLTEEQRKLGAELFDSLFKGKIATRFEQSLAGVEALEGVGLRIRLDLDAAQDEHVYLAALPWELLYKSETRDFLGRYLPTSIVRYHETHRPIGSGGFQGPLRVLLVTSAPEGYRDNDFATEARLITDAFEAHPDVDVDLLEQGEITEIRRRLRHDDIHVLHFIGHGGFDSKAGEGFLFCERADGKVHDLAGDMFAEFVKGIRSLRLVVLSSCFGAKMPRQNGQNLYSTLAPAVILAGVPAVVAMQFTISDKAAAAFSKALYTALAHGDPLDAAVMEGRLAIAGCNEVAGEWATPALFMRVKDGTILTRSAKAAKAAVGNGDANAPLRLGVRSFAKGWGEGMERRVDEVLKLEKHFDGRSIRDDALWHEAVYPELHRFLFKAALDRRPLIIDFAAHSSIAFGSGYCLEAKSGLDVRIIQRSQGDTYVLTSQDGIPPEGLLWSFEEETVDDGAADVALAVSVAWPVLDDVKVYVEESGLPVRRILSASVPEPGNTAIENGAHALRLAQQLARKIRSRTIDERRGTLHVFLSAPNTFVFFLGQVAKGFGKVQLYEHDFESGEVGAYRPSMRFPPTTRKVSL
jgi:hypothetical protein